MQKLILATTNPGKLSEFNDILKPYQWHLLSQAQFKVTAVAETGLTFVENALIKARHASAATRLPALADDSGLVVAALAGAPGIVSARFAGANATSLQNNAKLLAQMQHIPLDLRHAYFYCVIVMLQHANDPTPIIAEGRWDGMIAHAPKGSYGFGYDALFYVPSLGCHVAELAPQQKNTISHRALALQHLLPLMQVRLNHER